MKRRSFFAKSSLLALGSAGLSKIAMAADDSAASKAESGLNPVVMAPRHDGCEILWAVDSRSKGHVEYGLTEKLGSVARNDGWGLRPAGDKVIKVRIDDLEPGKTYFYRVVTESFNTKKPNTRKGGLHTFTTLDPAKDSCSFSVWNDTHKHVDTIKKLGEVTPKSDFLIWNGDVCNDWHTEEDIADTVLNANASGVMMTEKHPLFLVRGNHDIRGAEAAKLEEYCAMPDGKPWYAFRQGPVAVICMDTGEDKDDDNPYLFGRVACEPMRQEQAEWLEKVIERPEMKSAPYRIVFCHIPLRWTNETEKRSYDSNSKRSRDLWHPGLVKWGAQTLISGHMHRTALIQPTKEFPYAQMVGGGPKLNQATLITGQTDANHLVIQCKKLNGDLVSELKLKPLA